MSFTKERIKELELLETEDTKFCPKCSEIKPLYEFTVSKRERKMSHCWCRSCEARDRRERYHDMTMEEYEKLLEQQDYKCAICGTSNPGGRGTFHIDHDHKIKNKRDSFRGLLCVGCNHGLGNFKDNPEALIAAVAYLLKHKGKNNEISEV